MTGSDELEHVARGTVELPKIHDIRSFAGYRQVACILANWLVEEHVTRSALREVAADVDANLNIPIDDEDFVETISSSNIASALKSLLPFR